MKTGLAVSAAALLGGTVIAVAMPAQAQEQVWGAIAYSPLDGAAGRSSQQASESEARTEAVTDCVKNRGTGCQVIVTVHRPNCASLYANESLYGWGVGRHLDDARKRAFDDLGEPGSEVTFTCAFSTGTAPKSHTSAPPTPSTPAGVHPAEPTAPHVVPPPPPTLR